MTTKQVNLRIPVGLLEAIDARRDADLDRTGVIIGLLTSALTGEYIHPKENNATIINKLIKTINSLERTVKKLTDELTQALSAKESNVNSKSSPSKAANYYDDEDESDDDEINYSNEPETLDNLDILDVSSLPDRLTHEEMIDYFESGEVRCFNVHFTDGKIRELHTLSLDVIRAIDPDSESPQIYFATDIDYYQKIK